MPTKFKLRAPVLWAPSNLVPFSARDFGTHKYGCLMLPMLGHVKAQIVAWCRENVPDVDLGPGGRELESHITVKYGFKDSSLATARRLASMMVRHGPVTVRLNGLSLFTGENEDGHVLKVDVTSRDLHDLNRAVTRDFPCENKHPKYQPHVTVCYLDPAKSSRYDGLDAPFLNQQLTIKVAEWSGADGHKELWPLDGVSSLEAPLLPAYGEKALRLCPECPECPKCGGDETVRQRTMKGNTFCHACGHYFTDRNYGRPRVEHKVMSFLSETSGGALVRPPEMPAKVKRWVTMGGGSCSPDEGQHCGGTPVFIDDTTGEIKKGPPATVGKTPDELDTGPGKPPLPTPPAAAPLGTAPPESPTKAQANKQLKGLKDKLLAGQSLTPDEFAAMPSLMWQVGPYDLLKLLKELSAVPGGKPAYGLAKETYAQTLLDYAKVKSKPKEPGPPEKTPEQQAAEKKEEKAGEEQEVVAEAEVGGDDPAIPGPDETPGLVEGEAGAATGGFKKGDKVKVKATGKKGKVIGVFAPAHTVGIEYDDPNDFIGSLSWDDVELIESPAPGKKVEQVPHGGPLPESAGEGPAKDAPSVQGPAPAPKPKPVVPPTSGGVPSPIGGSLGDYASSSKKVKAYQKKVLGGELLDADQIDHLHSALLDLTAYQVRSFLMSINGGVEPAKPSYGNAKQAYAQAVYDLLYEKTYGASEDGPEEVDVLPDEAPHPPHPPPEEGTPDDVYGEWIPDEGKEKPYGDYDPTAEGHQANAKEQAEYQMGAAGDPKAMIGALKASNEAVTNPGEKKYWEDVVAEMEKMSVAGEAAAPHPGGVGGPGPAEGAPGPSLGGKYGLGPEDYDNAGKYANAIAKDVKDEIVDQGGSPTSVQTKAAVKKAFEQAEKEWNDYQEADEAPTASPAAAPAKPKNGPELKAKHGDLIEPLHGTHSFAMHVPKGVILHDALNNAGFAGGMNDEFYFYDSEAGVVDMILDGLGGAEAAMTPMPAGGGHIDPAMGSAPSGWGDTDTPEEVAPDAGGPAEPVKPADPVQELDKLLSDYPAMVNKFPASGGGEKIAVKVEQDSPAGKEIAKLAGAKWSYSKSNWTVPADKAGAVAQALQKHGHLPNIFPKDAKGLANLKPVGKKLQGMTDPQLLQDADGNKFVAKKGKGPEHITQESAANKVYAAGGALVKPNVLYETPSGPVNLSPYVEGNGLKVWKKTASSSDIEKVHAELRKNFVLDALLGNWDVIGAGGAESDNILIGDDGKIYRIDNGGSLEFKALGGKKTADQWNEMVTDIDSMRDPNINPSTAAVFKGITDGEIAEQVQSLVGKKQAILDSVPESVRPVLGKRIDWLAQKYLPNLEKTPSGSAYLDKKPWKGNPVDQSVVYKPKGDAANHVAFKQYADADKRDGFTFSNAPLGLKKRTSKWEDNVSPEAYQGVRQYTGGGYKELNEQIRNCPDTLDCLSDAHKEWAKNIDEGLAAAGVLDKPITVWRRFTLSNQDRKDLYSFAESAAANGEVIKIPGVKSAATNPHSWSGETILEIRARTGVYAAPFTKSGQGENEFIQGHNVKYKVVGVKEVDLGGYAGKQKVIQLEEVL